MPYTPAPEGWWQEFLGALPAHTAKLAVVKADGSPHVAPVWIDLDGDDVDLHDRHPTRSRDKAILRDPRVSICVDDERPAVQLRDDQRAGARLARSRRAACYWATRIAGRYMGADRADEYGRRNSVSPEMVVRVHTDKSRRHREHRGLAERGERLPQRRAHRAVGREPSVHRVDELVVGQRGFDAVRSHPRAVVEELHLDVGLRLGQREAGEPGSPVAPRLLLALVRRRHADVVGMSGQLRRQVPRLPPHRVRRRRRSACLHRRADACRLGSRRSRAGTRRADRPATCPCGHSRPAR